MFYSEVDKMSTTLSEKSSSSFSTGTTTSDDGSDTLFNKKINEVANSFERTTSDDCSDTLFNNKINEVANAIEREQAALAEDEMIDNHTENEGDEVVDDRVHEEEVVEDDAIAELHRLEAQRAFDAINVLDVVGVSVHLNGRSCSAHACCGEHVVPKSKLLLESGEYNPYTGVIEMRHPLKR